MSEAALYFSLILLRLFITGLILYLAYRYFARPLLINVMALYNTMAEMMMTLKEIREELKIANNHLDRRTPLQSDNNNIH